MINKIINHRKVSFSSIIKNMFRSIYYLILFFCFFSLSYAGYFEIELNSQKYNVDDLIEAKIYVVPEKNEIIFTSSLSASYEGAQVLEFSFDDELLPFYNNKFNYINNDKKQFKKTAGKFNGFTKKTKFATITFIPDNSSSVFKLKVNNDSALIDGYNNNTITKYYEVFAIIDNVKLKNSLSGESEYFFDKEAWVILSAYFFMFIGFLMFVFGLLFYIKSRLNKMRKKRK